MKEKIFILGVGCQKGGTTWLSEQLIKDISVNMGFEKEYHVFDTLYINPRPLDILLQQLNDINKNNKLMKSNPNLLRHIDFYRDINNYFDYLWIKNDINIVGDITPAYAGLPKMVFQDIKKHLILRGFKIKVIFLMRDPLERCWSAVRMHRKINSKNNIDLKIQDEQKELSQFYSLGGCKRRTTYEITIANLQSVFSSEEIFFGIYETLFELQNIQKLEEFLGVSSLSHGVNEIINKSPKNIELNEELSAEIVNFYKDTYLFCDQEFGLNKIWNGFKYLQTQ